MSWSFDTPNGVHAGLYHLKYRWHYTQFRKQKPKIIGRLGCGFENPGRGLQMYRAHGSQHLTDAARRKRCIDRYKISYRMESQ
jgi:hypothetical protein